MSDNQALADVYSELLGTGDSTAGDFIDASDEELKSAILEHFEPGRMEALFKEAFIRGIKYAIFQQQHQSSPITEADFFGDDGLITKHIDWDEAMLDW